MRCRVRPYDNSDYAAIIEVQTDSFHTSNPVPFLNALTYNNFRAEVVDALRQKTKYSDPANFQLLVAEELPSAATTNAASKGSDEDASTVAGERSSTDSVGSSNRIGGRDLQEVAPGGWRGAGAAGTLVGSVEVSLMQDRGVLRALPRRALAVATSSTAAAEYAYISSMCVRASKRRHGVAQALLAAAEAQARRWRQPRLALHVYKDNVPAVDLYRRCGMRVIAEDPSWRAMLGGRVRLLMYKELPLGVREDGAAQESTDGAAPAS